MEPKYSPYNPGLNTFGTPNPIKKRQRENVVMYNTATTEREKQVLSQKRSEFERTNKNFYDFKNYEKQLSNEDNKKFLKVKTESQTHSIQFDTKDRNLAVYPNPTDLTITLPTIYRDVTSFKISNFRLLNTIEEFTPENGNVDLYIQEKGREIKRIRIESGSYKDIGELQSQLNEKLRFEPEFYHYPDGFADFVEKFRISGSFSLNFNNFQYYKKDTRINEFIARRRDQDQSKDFKNSVPEDDIIIPSTVDTYFNTELRDSIGFTTYSVDQAKIAYYYPVLKKLVENKEEENFILPESATIAGVTYTQEQLEDRVLTEFQGLEDEVIDYLIDLYITTITTYRLENTFYCNLANEYVVSVDDQTNKIKISATALSRSILDDINVKIDEFTEEVKNDIGYTDQSGSAAEVQEARQLFAQLTELYNIFQSANASNLGIDYNSLTVEQFLDKNTKITPKLVTNDNYDSIVKELNNDIIDVSNAIESQQIVGELLDFPDIRGSNYFNQYDITTGISGTTFSSSNIDETSFITIDSNLTNISFKADIQQGNYNIYKYNPANNFKGTLYLTPLFEENPDSYRIRYKTIQDQLDEDKQVITQSNLTLEPILYKDISEQTSLFTISGLTPYSIAEGQKLRFRFTPTETKIYNFVAYPGPNITGTQLNPVIHMYGELSQFIGDQQQHYFANENGDYYIVKSDDTFPELYKYSPFIYDISSSTTEVNYGLISEVLEAGRTYYFTVRGQNVNVFNNNVYIAVYDPVYLNIPSVNITPIAKSTIQTVRDASLNDLQTFSNVEFTCKDFILNSNPIYSNIGNDEIVTSNNIYDFFGSYIKITELSISNTNQSIEYEDISIPNDNIYFSFHLLVTDASGTETNVYEDDISRCLFEISGNDNFQCILSNQTMSLVANNTEYSVNLDLSFGTDISDIIGGSNFLNYVIELNSSKTAKVYVRKDTEYETDNYVEHSFNYDFSENIFDSSRNISFFNSYDNTKPFYGKIHGFSSGSNQFTDISETYPDYFLTYESTYDSINKLFVGDIDVEANMIFGNRLIPTDSNITGFIDNSNDVLLGHQNLPYLTNISGGTLTKVSGGIQLSNREHIIIPYFENTTDFLPVSPPSDISNIQSSIFSVFCKPDDSNVAILSSDYDDISNVGFRESIYIDISNGILRAGFDNDSTTELSGSVLSYINAGDEMTISYAQNINVQYPDPSAGISFQIISNLQLVVNDTVIDSKNVVENPATYSDNLGVYLRPAYGLTIGKRGGTYFSGEVYNVTFFRQRNQAIFNLGFLGALHEVNMKNDNFKTGFVAGLEQRIIAQYNLDTLMRNSQRVFVIPNQYNRFYSTPDGTRDTNQTGSIIQPYRNSLQLFNYDSANSTTNPFIQDTSGISYENNGDLSSLVFPTSYRSEYNGTSDISRIQNVSFLGNGNIISHNYYLDVSSIYSNDGSFISTISGGDISAFNTLTLVNNFKQNHESFSIYMDISTVPISGEELTLVQFFDQTDISQSSRSNSPRLYYSGLSNLIFGSAETNVNSDNLELTFLNDPSGSGVINHRILMTYNNNTNEFGVRIFGNRTISGEETLKRFNTYTHKLNNFVIGCDISLNNLFAGELYEIRVFNEALTLTQSLEFEEMSIGSNSYSNFPTIHDDRLGQDLEGSNVSDLRLNTSQTQAYRFNDLSDVIPTLFGDSLDTHYIFNNQNISNSGSFSYNSHELSANQLYVYDLSEIQNTSFSFETSFIASSSNSNFVIFQSENFLLDVQRDISNEYINRLLVYTGSSNDPLFLNERIKIPQNQLNFITFSYDNPSRGIFLDINGTRYETQLPTDITTASVEPQKTLSFYGLYGDTRSSREVYDSTSNYNQRMVNSYMSGEVKHIRIYDYAQGRRQNQIERSLSLNTTNDISSANSFISHQPEQITTISIGNNDSMISGTRIFDITPVETGFYSIQRFTNNTDSGSNISYITSIYTSSEYAGYDLSNYTLSQFRSSNLAEYVIDGSFNPILALNSNNTYYASVTAYHATSNIDISLGVSVDLLTDFRTISGLNLLSRVNSNVPELYELRDLEYIAKSKITGKRDSKYYNVKSIPTFLPDVHFSDVRITESNATDYPIYSTGLDISFVVYDSRNTEISRLNFDDGMRYIYTDNGNPEMFIYDDLEDLVNDMSSTNFRTQDIPGTGSWGGETGSLLFAKDKLSGRKVYPGFSNLNLFNNTTYYIAIRSAYPTQQASYNFTLSGETQEIGFRTITIEQLLNDISNAYEETSVKEFDLYYPSYIFLGRILADELIDYSNTTDLDKIIFPTHTRNTRVLTPLDVSNTLIPILLSSFNKFTDSSLEKLAFQVHINDLETDILLNYMATFTSSFMDALNYEKYDASVASKVKLVNYSTELLQMQMNNLLVSSLKAPSITYNNNYNIHHVLLNTFEEIFEALGIQREDKLYSATSESLIADLSGNESLINDAVIKLAGRFFDPDISNLYVHELNPGVSINKVDGNDSLSLSGQLHSNFSTISGTLFSSTSNFITGLITDASNETIEIKDLSSTTIKTAVDSFFTNDLSFSAYTADPSGRYYENKITGIINQFFVDLGITDLSNDTYDDAYRASLVGADSFFHNNDEAEKTITLGNNIINTFEPVDITVNGYIDAYEENGTEDLRSIYEQFIAIEGSLQPEEINTQVRSKLREYLQQQYAGILPDTFADRERFNDPIEFRIYFREFLTDEQKSRRFNWGLGYNLGFDKVDTSYNTVHEAQNIPQFLGENYVYLLVNDSEDFNRGAMAYHDNNAENVIIPDVSGIPGTAIVSDIATFGDGNQYIGGRNKYYAKIRLSSFGSYTTSITQYDKVFNPPLSQLEKVRFRLVDRYGNVINNSECDFEGVISIKTDVKTITDA